MLARQPWVCLFVSIVALFTGIDPARSADAQTAAAALDFKIRCAQPGVVKCVGFDRASDIRGRYPQPSGIMIGASEPVLDNRVKASGESALKFTIPSQSPANTSGSYFTNFADDLSIQFGENQEFFVQWRQRFSPEFLAARYRGGKGWKLMIVGTGDQPGKPYASCTALEVVAQTYHAGLFPILYNSCTGSTSHRAYDLFREPLPPYDFKIMNARPAPHCLYSQGTTGSFFPPAGNCFGYFPDEWMTFQLRIKTGPRIKDEFANSTISLWMARENQPSQLVIDFGPYPLSAGDPASNQRFGKVWLLPYHTGKDPTEIHPVAYTWYDELIISRSKIDDPGTSSAVSR